MIVGSIATIIACSFLLWGILKVSNNYRLNLKEFMKKGNIISRLFDFQTTFIIQERQRYLILWLGITSFTLCGCLLIFIIRISSQTTNTFKVIKVDMIAYTFQIYFKFDLWYRTFWIYKTLNYFLTGNEDIQNRSHYTLFPVEYLLCCFRWGLHAEAQ